MFRKSVMLLAAAAVMGLATAPIAQAADAPVIPKNKRTDAGKYISAKDTFEFVTSNRDKVLFVDIRTTPELMFVGMTEEVDAVVPFVEVASPAEWDDKEGRFKLVPNPSFVPQVKAALEAKGLDRHDKVILICRSGDRTAGGVNALVAAGFTNAYSLYEGFEGDLSEDGRRDVNGWKNAGLPWTYKLDKAKALPPAAAAE
jgi:rhodanese-related sulfurtransferase